MQRLKEILTTPVTAITKAKKEKSLSKTFLILILSWILLSMSFFLSFYKELMIIIALGSALTIFLFGILFSIFYSYVIDILMNVLGGKGKYYDSLTAATYSSFPISLGLLITSIATLVHPYLGLIVGFISISFTVALSFSIYFRAIKDLYSTDMLTTFIGLLIIIYVFIITSYITTAFSMNSMLFGNLLSTFRI